MQSGSKGVFTEEFERVLVQTDTSIRRLARLSKVPRRTLENWLYGHTRRPRHIEPILQVAQALHLPAHDTDRLLTAAGHLSLAQLKKGNNRLASELLQDWQLAPNTLMGQKSAALAAQHNLPAATTPFLGRHWMRDEVAGLLRTPDVRLVTIFGLGGAGKTRLALETARSLIDWFDHGVYFIPLDNVNGTESFWEAILDGMHIPADGANLAQQLIEEYLWNKQVLLLVDNFEHLLPLTTEIGRFLSKTQRLKLLVTSRHALDLQAEHLYPINGLPRDKRQNSPAYRFFIQTARRRTPGYAPSTQEAEDIITLCDQVDGLPLAIELAASWTDVLSPAQILQQLTNGLRAVWHDAGDRPSRQKSLWEVFDYSWQMLSTAVQEAAMCISILRGSFTATTAMAIADCSPEIIKHLIQASIIGRTTGSRLLLHPLVRQFLLEQAIEAGHTVKDLEEQFMQVTLTWASSESRGLEQTFKTTHLQNLHAEWQHIERAWWLAVKYQRFDLLELCLDLLAYFEARGTWGQGNVFFETTRQQIPVTNRRVHARLDEAQAVFAFRLNEPKRAVKLAQRSLKILGELGVDAKKDEAGTYARMVLFGVQFALEQTSLNAESVRALRQVIPGHFAKFLELSIKLAAGSKHCMHAEYVQASKRFQEAIDMSGDDAYVIPILHCFLGISLQSQGQETAARNAFTLALQRGLEINVIPAVIVAIYELRFLDGDNPSVKQCQEALESLALELGSRRTVGRVSVQIAIQYLNLGLFKRARRLMRIGIGMVWNEIDTPERARILSTAAQAYIAFGLIKTAPQVVSLFASDLDTRHIDL